MGGTTVDDGGSHSTTSSKNRTPFPYSSCPPPRSFLDREKKARNFGDRAEDDDIAAPSHGRPEREQSSDENIGLETERAQEFANSRPKGHASPPEDEVVEGRTDDIGAHQSGENRHSGSRESREKTSLEDNDKPSSIGVAGSNGGGGGHGYFDDDDIDFDVDDLEDVEM